MASFSYDGSRVDIALDNINKIVNNFSNLSTSIRSATNKIVSARGFQQYVGGISSDTFSGYVDECGAAVTNLTTSIREKQIAIMAYSEDKDMIHHFLDGLSNFRFIFT